MLGEGPREIHYELEKPTFDPRPRSMRSSPRAGLKKGRARESIGGTASISQTPSAMNGMEESRKSFFKCYEDRESASQAGIFAARIYSSGHGVGTDVNTPMTIGSFLTGGAYRAQAGRDGLNLTGRDKTLVRSPVGHQRVKRGVGWMFSQSGESRNFERSCHEQKRRHTGGSSSLTGEPGGSHLGDMQRGKLGLLTRCKRSSEPPKLVLFSRPVRAGKQQSCQRASRSRCSSRNHRRGDRKIDPTNGKDTAWLPIVGRSVDWIVSRHR